MKDERDPSWTPEDAINEIDEPIRPSEVVVSVLVVLVLLSVALWS